MKTRFSTLLCSASVLAALTGCSSYQLAEPRSPLAPFDPPPPDRARVCVVRTSILAQAVTFPVRDDGVLVGATRGPSTFCYLAEPGRHVLTMEADETAQAELLAEPGGRYYLKQEVDFLFGWVTCRPVWVREPVARELVDETFERVLVGVPGSERLPGETPFAPALGPSVSSR